MKHLLRIVLLLLLAAQAWRAYGLARFESYLEDAKVILDEGDPEESAIAVESVMRAIETREEPEAWNWLGDAALDVYRNDPKGGWPKEDADVLFRLAWQGYAGAVLRCPVDSWAWSGLAETALREARRVDRDAPIPLGEIERRGEGVLNGRFAVALAAAQLAVKLQPSGYQQLDVLARIYEATGELDQAREAYARSARMMPAPSYHVWGGGRRRLLQDLYATILENLEQGLAIAPAFEKCMLHLDVGRFARDQGDFETALANLRTAKAAAPDAYWIYESARELAALYESQGRFAEALAELDDVRASGFGFADATRKSATLLARLQKFDEACVRFREAMREGVEDAGLRAEASRSCEASGDLDAAEEFLRDGVRDPSRDLDLARALLEFYRRHGKDRSADSIIEAWVREYPQSVELQKWKSEIVGGGF